MINEIGLYDIYCNGSPIYKTAVTKTKIIVFKYDDQVDNNIGDKIYEIKKYNKIFIPVESKIGNTLLVETTNNNYIYIGPEIFSFKTKEPILIYSSPLSLDGIPFPYAITKTLTYLLLDRVTLPNKLYAQIDYHNKIYKSMSKVKKLKYTKKIVIKMIKKSNA